MRGRRGPRRGPRRGMRRGVRRGSRGRGKRLRRGRGRSTMLISRGGIRL